MGDQTDLGDGTDAGDGRVNGSRRERRLADVPEAFGHGDDLMPAPASAASREASRLIEEHLDLVNHVVFQVAVHFPRHVDRDELVRAGALGLVEAAQPPTQPVPRHAHHVTTLESTSHRRWCG